MKATKQHREIFKKGSKTYFNSSLFFPEKIREEVTILYAFVRTADDFVDEIPQQPEKFYMFREEYDKCLKGEKCENIIIFSFVELMKKRDFKSEWVNAFLDSMEMDLTKSIYKNEEEILKYIYGSAEVIGLFMAKIMGLPDESFFAARMLGRSMQYINFIRDIKEDNSLGRQYLPLEKTTLKNLSEEEVKSKPDEFISFHKEQIKKYRKWQMEAEKGYIHIPYRYLIPIKTAADCYLWTAEKIEKNPFIVFRKKIKPAKPYIFLTMLINGIICAIK